MISARWGCKNQINTDFEKNLSRVQNLVNLYDRVTSSGQGRRRVEQQDILRAAVVFLHASLEDLLRELLRKYLPSADEGIWDDLEMPLAGMKGPKFTLYHLATWRGSDVDDVFEDSVDAYLEKSNFNHVADLRNGLEYLGLDPELVRPFADDIGPLIKRRHHVVHRFDVDRSLKGEGNRSARSLSLKGVETWCSAIERFGNCVLASAEEQL